MVDGVSPFYACDGGSDSSACGGAQTSKKHGNASRGVPLGLSMVVSCWLVGRGAGGGGGGGGGSAMVDGFLD